MTKAFWLAVVLLFLVLQVAVGAPSTIVLSIEGMT